MSTAFEAADRHSPAPGDSPGPGADVEFRVLGAVEAMVNGRPLKLGAPMDRLVLTALLLAKGRALSTEELTDRLWGNASPETSPELLRDYLKKARRHLDKAGSGTGAALLPRYDGGYRARVDPARVDLHRFDDRVAEAARLAGRDDAKAAALLRAALKEWRADDSGPDEVHPLAGLPGTWAEGQRSALRGRRQAAFVDCVKAELRLGGHEQRLIPELALWLDAKPQDEQLVELLMLAYVHAGRRGDALNLFHITRERLLEEQGSDPSPRLENLRRRILQEDPALLPPPRREPSAHHPGATMPSTHDHDQRDDHDLASRAARLVAETSARGGTADSGGTGGTALAGRLRAQFTEDPAAATILAWVVREPDSHDAVAALERALVAALARDRSFADDVRRLAGAPSPTSPTRPVSINATTIGKATVFNETVQVSGDFTIN